jgi:hypothetical protein
MWDRGDGSARTTNRAVTAVRHLSTVLGRHGFVDFEERMVTKQLKEVERADRGQQPSSSLTRSCAASVQRAPLLLQWRGGGSRDALSIVGATRHGRKCEPRRRWRRGAIGLERLKDC